MQIFFNSFPVRFKPFYTVLTERIHNIRQKANRLNHVISHNGHEHVEFEVSLTGCKADRRIVSHNLCGYHGHRFSLSGIDLRRHNGTTRFVSGNNEFANTATRSRRQPAHIVGNLHQITGQGFQHAVSDNEFILTRQRVKLIFCRSEYLTRQTTQLFSKERSELIRAVDARTHSRSTGSQITQELASLHEHLPISFNHAGPTADFLP